MEVYNHYWVKYAISNHKLLNMWHIPHRKLTPMRTSVITNGDMITHYSLSMMTKHATAAAKSPVLLKENITHYFINFTAHISRLHTEFEDLLLFLCISHFNISTLHSPPPLCPVTDKIAVPHQKGTRSRHKYPLYYLFTCMSCLYCKQHFIRPHAVQL